LGRGLQALITDTTDSRATHNEIREIYLKDIDPNPGQPRREFDLEKLQELATSIREHGLLQPILVRPHENRFYIIAGERRFRAAGLAGLDRIECLILDDCDELAMTEKALIENLQRADLSPVEEGMAYARLIEEYALTQDEIAKRIGKSRSTITNLLRVIQLPSEILDLLNRGQISLGHAKVLLSIDSTEGQLLVAKKIAHDGLSVRKTEELLKKTQKETAPLQPAQARQPLLREYNYLEDIEEKLKALLQTKVRLKGDATKGKIEIEYFSREELERLLEKWNLSF